MPRANLSTLSPVGRSRDRNEGESREGGAISTEGLLTEARLRKLYAEGAIGLGELEASLDRINARREAMDRNRESAAERPVTARPPPSRREPAPGPTSPRASIPDTWVGARCPDCGSAHVEVSRSPGRVSLTCPSCVATETQRIEGGRGDIEGAERYLASRGHGAREDAPGVGWVGGVYFESGPDLDGDGDVDGGLFDTLGG
jgi:hypothetical protein